MRRATMSTPQFSLHVTEDAIEVQLLEFHLTSHFLAINWGSYMYVRCLCPEVYSKAPMFP
jgi:hypothetical protein